MSSLLFKCVVRGRNSLGMEVLHCHIWKHLHVLLLVDMPLFFLLTDSLEAWRFFMKGLLLLCSRAVFLNEGSAEP
jgi:hypothetical protein